MKKSNISTKIKILGALFTILLLSIVGTTIYMNSKNSQDALIINIAGKQRMLTQNISKNIFYIYSNKNANQTELNNSINEFIYNLSTLRGEQNIDKLKKAPNEAIFEQMIKVEHLWANFYENLKLFNSYIYDENKKNELKIVVENIHNTNTNLLNEVDSLVTLYTINSEKKIKFIKYTQYFFVVLIVLILFFSFLELKEIEKNALKFLEESKKIMNQNLNKPLKPIKIEAEGELVEASNIFNNFLNKINSAIIDSNNALEQSKNASLKLEDITNEFYEIIDEIQNSKELSKQLNKSEDIAIETQEQLIHINKRLQELKNQLEKIIYSCKSK